MNKALLYILLFVGISFVVFFAGGLLAGVFVNLSERHHDLPKSDIHAIAMTSLVIVTLWGAIQHVVFLKFGYADYSMGRLNKTQLWKMTLAAFMVFLGLKMLDRLLISVGDDTDVLAFYDWMHLHPVASMTLLIIINVTLDLVIIGGIFREINDHYRKPAITIPIAAGVFGLITGLISGGQGTVLYFLFFLIAFWIYECTHSVLPIVIGDMLTCFYELVPDSFCTNGWIFIPASILILVSALAVFRIMRYTDV